MNDIINKVHHADCLEFMRGMPDGSIDSIVTDPPFSFAGGLSNGRTSQVDSQFFSYWWKGVCDQLSRVLKPEGEGFVWCDWRTASSFADGFRPDTQTNDFWRVSQMLYHYREMPGMGRPFRSSVDMIAYIRGPKSKGERIPATTHNWISKYWYYGKHKYHPAEKDPVLCEQLLKWSSDETAIILDPFCGSGTTLVAAKMLGRRYIGIDIKKKCCDIAEERLRNTTPPLPFKAEKQEQGCLL